MKPSPPLRPEPPRRADDWNACTFAGARDAVLLLGKRLSFREKVQWLEEAARTATALRRLPEGPASGQTPLPPFAAPHRPS